MAKKDYTYDPKFANWNRFYDDLFQEIAEIRNVGNKALLDFNNQGGYLVNYYGRIVNLFSTHKHYINNEAEIEKQLNIIEDTLFSPKYVDAVLRKKNSGVQHIKIMRALRKAFTDMCESFSSNGISVKVSGKKKRDKGKAILEGYD